jgi:xanthine dehydrogenase accessory factor
MDNVDAQVLKTADAWLREGRRAVMGTIVRTWGSAPRPVGALVVIRDDGLVVGSVSGGCIEDDLVERVRSRAGPQQAAIVISACAGAVESPRAHRAAEDDRERRG